MNQDPLDKLARALAAEHDGAYVAPDVTRARIMQQLVGERRKKRLRLLCFAPLLGVGIGSSAFAAAGTGWPAALAWVPALFAADASPEDVAKKTLATSRPDVPRGEAAAPASGSTPSAAPAPDSALEVPPVASTVGTTASLASPPASPPLARSPRTSSSSAEQSAAPPVPKAQEAPARERRSPEPSAPTDIGLAVYRRGHDAQFRAADFKTALAAYRRYLAEHPGGVLAAEASYNAALCELRLGQREAARRSLAPFARGAYGSYRQEEARALLEALGAP